MGNPTTIDVSMTLDITALQEIVVVGYGTQKSKPNRFRSKRLMLIRELIYRHVAEFPASETLHFERTRLTHPFHSLLF